MTYNGWYAIKLNPTKPNKYSLVAFIDVQVISLLVSSELF